MNPTYRGTRIVGASAAMGPVRGERIVNLWRVIDKQSSVTVFGPATWQECCAYKQGLRGRDESSGARRGAARLVGDGRTAAAASGSLRGESRSGLRRR